MSDEMKTSTDHSESESIAEFARERTLTSARLAVVVVTDAALFVVWILIAWGTHVVAEFAMNRGVHEYFANGFLWLSSAATFLLTLFFIVADVVKEYQRLFGSTHSVLRRAK